MLKYRISFIVLVIVLLFSANNGLCAISKIDSGEKVEQLIQEGTQAWDNNIEGAIEKFNAALVIDPNSSRAYWGLGISYCMQKKYKEGVSTLQKGADLSAPKDKIVFYSGIVIAYVNEKDFDNAERYLNMIQDIDPKSTIAALGLGDVSHGRGDDAKAKEYWEKAAEWGQASGDAGMVQKAESRLKSIH